MYLKHYHLSLASPSSSSPTTSLPSQQRTGEAPWTTCGRWTWVRWSRRSRCQTSSPNPRCCLWGRRTRRCLSTWRIALLVSQARRWKAKSAEECHRQGGMKGMVGLHLNHNVHFPSPYYRMDVDSLEYVCTEMYGKNYSWIWKFTVQRFKQLICIRWIGVDCRVNCLMYLTKTTLTECLNYEKMIEPSVMNNS